MEFLDYMNDRTKVSQEEYDRVQEMVKKELEEYHREGLLNEDKQTEQ